MTTYRTGNPIGSTDPKDLYDNAENTDVFVNSLDREYWDDRFGRNRKTIHGMYQDFQEFLIKSGYVGLGPNGEIQDYAAGLEITDRNQVFRYEGELYRAGAELDLPYTTTGDWETEGPLFKAVGDQALRQILASQSGASEVGYGTETVNKVLDDFNGFAASGRISGFPISVESIQQLKSLPEHLLNETTTYIVKSYRQGSGQGGGVFKYTIDHVSENGGTIFSHETIGGFLRLYEGPMMAEWFGAERFILGESQDSTNAFRSCAEAAGRGGEWRWTGRHRITETVEIPFKQTFGSFGQMPFASVELYDVSNYQGVHTSPYPEWADKIDSAVFFDSESGDAFRLNEGATADNFLIYGRGLIKKGWSTTDPSFIPTGSDYYPVTAIRHGKFIRVKNVTVTLFDTAFRSSPWESGGSYSGDYYSVFDSVVVRECYTAFYHVGNGPVFNKKIINPTIYCPRLIFTDSAVRNLVVLGGSIEGFSAPNNIHGGSEVNFIGTYFETFKDANLPAYFYLSSQTVSISLKNCLVYMNNIQRFVDSPSGHVVHVISSANKFVSAQASMKIIYNFNLINRYGSLVGDRITGDGSTNVTYAPQAGNSENCLYVNPMVS